jgi:hypothetical protein
MNKLIPISAPILLIIGTAGLLLNEFIFNWGRVATITFAVLSVFGLILMTISMWQKRASIVNNSEKL